MYNVYLPNSTNVQIPIKTCTVCQRNCVAQLELHPFLALRATTKKGMSWRRRQPFILHSNSSFDGCHQTCRSEVAKPLIVKICGCPSADIGKLERKPIETTYSTTNVGCLLNIQVFCCSFDVYAHHGAHYGYVSKPIGSMYSIFTYIYH